MARNYDNGEKHKLSLKFTIRNFLDHVCEPGQVLESPWMECAQHCGAKWTLQVYPYGKSKAKRSHIAVFLKLVDKLSHFEVTSATYEIYVVGKYGMKAFSTGALKTERDLRKAQGSLKFITRSDIASNRSLYLPNGHLTVCCDGEALLKIFHQTPTLGNFPELTQVFASNPASILKKMFEESICSDLILKTGSSEFKCHKAILATTSVYFKNLIHLNMKTEKTYSIDLSKDLNGVQLKAIVNYVYLGERDLSYLPGPLLQKLFRVSGKYEMHGLVEICEMELIKRLNKDNAREMILFAMTYCAKRLEKAAATIIAKGEAQRTEF